MDVANVAIVIALVDAVKRIVPAQVQGIVTIVVAIIVGGLVGIVNGDTSLLQGAVDGLVAVGAVTTASRIGN